MSSLVAGYRREGTHGWTKTMSTGGDGVEG